jgi:hypothetical protein
MSEERLQQYRALPVRQVDEVLAISCFQCIVNEVTCSRCQGSGSTGPTGETVNILKAVPRRGSDAETCCARWSSRLDVDVGMISDNAEVFASSW